MNIILSALIAIIIILLLMIYAILFNRIGRMRKEEFSEKTIDKVSSLINTKMAEALDQSKSGPWYLVVYTKDSDYPIWISHNTIRSVHPDPKNYKIIIKQFNGEGVIENVESYEMCAANDLCDYDM